MTTHPRTRVALPKPDGTYKAGGSQPAAYEPSPPDLTQLLNLTNRAESGLTPGEAAHMREGIAALAARITRAEQLAAELESCNPGGLIRRDLAAHMIRSALTSPRPAPAIPVP